MAFNLITENEFDRLLYSIMTIEFKELELLTPSPDNRPVINYAINRYRARGRYVKMYDSFQGARKIDIIVTSPTGRLLKNTFMDFNKVEKNKAVYTIGVHKDFVKGYSAINAQYEPYFNKVYDNARTDFGNINRNRNYAMPIQKDLISRIKALDSNKKYKFQKSAQLKGQVPFIQNYASGYYNGFQFERLLEFYGIYDETGSEYGP